MLDQECDRAVRTARKVFDALLGFAKRSWRARSPKLVSGTEFGIRERSRSDSEQWGDLLADALSDFRELTMMSLTPSLEITT